METAKPKPANPAIKWSLIYIIVSIVFTYLFEFLKIDSNSPVRYITLIPFAAFLLLTQKEYKDSLGGFIKFGDSFVTGLLYSVFTGVLAAIFTYVYYAILSPAAYEEILTAMQAKLAESGKVSEEQIEGVISFYHKYGMLITTGTVLLFTPVMGVIISLIGAAIFKKERTLFDIEQAEANKPFPDNTL